MAGHARLSLLAPVVSLPGAAKLAAGSPCCVDAQLKMRHDAD